MTSRRSIAFLRRGTNIELAGRVVKANEIARSAEGKVVVGDGVSTFADLPDLAADSGTPAGINIVANSGSAQELDCAGGQAAFEVTEDAACTYTLTGAIAGVECIVTLHRISGGFTPVLPECSWANDLPIPPTLAAGKADVFVWVTYDGENWIGSAFATNFSSPALPGVPLNVVATPGDTTVSLTWDAPIPNFPASTSYEVYRRVGAGAYAALATVNFGDLPYVDTGLTNDTEYGYKVSAVNAIGEGPQSAEETATPVAPVVGPDAADAFNRANGALGNLDTGQAWVLTGTWQVVANRCDATAAAASNGFALVEVAGVSDGVMLLDIAADSRRRSAMFRYVDVDNFWFLEVDLTSNLTKIYKIVGGAGTEMGSLAGGFTGGVSATYEITLAGSSIIITRDTIEIFNVTDAALAATGDTYGMRTYDGAGDGGFFDNFSFTAA